MTDHPDYARIARALNSVATALQQLAVECDTAARATRVVLPYETDPAQMSDAQLRRHLAAAAPMTPAEPALPASMYRDRGPLDEPPASVAEPECGCSLYFRCDSHDFAKPRGCTCNGPQYASSSCPVKDGTGLSHAGLAHQYPDRDPALLD